VRAPGVSRVRGGGGGVPEPEPGGRGPAGAAIPTQPAALVRPAPQSGSGLVFEHFGPLFSHYTGCKSSILFQTFFLL
jgi:hypothetical protein